MASTSPVRPARPAGPRSAARKPDLHLIDQARDSLIPNLPGVEDFLDGRRISLDLLDDNPEQPRTGELPGIEELAASIKEYGLLQLIVVDARRNGRYRVIAGHRRVAAFRWLREHDDPGQWESIPALERATPETEQRIVALVENLGREDLSPEDVITSLGILHDTHGWNQREIARRVGRTAGWVNQHFRIAQDAAVRPVVREIGLAKSHAIVLAKSPEAKDAALRAALDAAPLNLVRGIASGREPYSDYTGAASAARTASPRSFAEVADEMDLEVDLSQAEIVKLYLAALQRGSPMGKLGDFLRMINADGEWGKSLVKLALRR